MQRPRPLPASARGLLEAARPGLEACVRCGLCLETCPTYVLTGLEEESPRGRIAIGKALLDGHLAVSEDLVRHEMSCLLCEACTSVCPAGVRMEEIGVALRAALRPVATRDARERLTGRAVRALGDRGRLELGVRAIGWSRKGPLRKPAAAILRSLGLDAASLPEVTGRFLRPDGGGWRPLDREPRGRVVLFAGCVMSTLLAPIDVATGELLAAAGFEVRVVAGQSCCGALAAHLGDSEEAERLIRRNIQAFTSGPEPLLGDEGEAPIVVNSAGCGAFLKAYGRYGGEPGARVARRIRDLTEILVESDLDLSGPAPEGPVGYQDACHLRLAQRIIDPPRELLRRIPGLKLVELAEQDLCCGSAGVYNLTHPSEADALLSRKVEAMRSCGARTVVTANPGCLLQLRAGARRAKLPVEILHIAEVLRTACPVPVERLGGP